MSSRSWNRVELIGNLTRDPELRYTPNGAAVCTFGLATNRTYVTEGERKEEVDFHRLVAWNKLAELCNQLLKKGNKVFISGRLQTRNWEGNDGQQRQTTEIVVEDMIVLTPKVVNGDMETPPLPKEEEAVAIKEEKIEEKEIPQPEAGQPLAEKEEPKKPKEPVAATEEVSEDLPF